ncbi:extracellular solute-binding protein [Archangium minus]|uniref:Extracellular solute-binding protein n=2 Tax=Archangium minus TaxID=83450 RepID=A0ABY9X4X6_9BACT|nr:extracellular solute-binding protein [Archangium minus]
MNMGWRKNRWAYAAVGGFVVVAAALGYWLSPRAPTPPAPSTSPVELSIAQSVGADFNGPLEELLRPFLEQHPEVRLSVRYDAHAREGSDGAARGPHLALRVSNGPATPGGVPLFASDYVVLAYNRDLVPEAPKTWRDIIAHGYTLKEKGTVPYGIVLAEEMHSLLPFFGDLFQAGGPGDTTREAFALLSDLRFKYGLTPGACLSECVVQVFKEGRAPFAVIGEWRLPELRSALGGKLGLTAIPALPGSGARVRPVQRVYALFRAGEAPKRELEAADALLRFVEKESASRLMATLGKAALQPVAASASAEELALAAASVDAVEVPEARVRAAEAALAPIWEQFATGRLSAEGAARSLVAAVSTPARN